MKWGLALVLAAVAMLAIYIRVAPSDPARWHVAVMGGDADTPSGARRLLPGRADDLARLDRVIRATPRTRVLAGSVAEGHVTYITRSALWGFPDYTTVQVRGDDLAIWARLRFGGSDLGVNGKRLKGWLTALG